MTTPSEPTFDDAGNPRVDFAWGNLPIQPTGDSDWYNRCGTIVIPGDGFAEFLASGRADEFNYRSYANLQNEDEGLKYVKGMRPSQWLRAEGNHEIAIDYLSGYPQFDPESPASPHMPNLFPSTRDEALEALRRAGVPEQYLKDFTFSGGQGGAYDTSGTPNWDGVVFYAYKDPNDIIGYHYSDYAHSVVSGPWYARESDGQVGLVSTYPGDTISIGGSAESIIGNFAIVITQTTDPTKDTYNWW